MTTEHQLADTAASGVYVFECDLNAAAAGDVFELRIYKMILTTGASRVLHIMTFYGPQLADDLIKSSVPVANELTDATALRFSIKQAFGTGRSIPWKVLKVAS